MKPEGLNVCQCSVWFRPNQSAMDRIRTAFAALKTPYFRTTEISARGKKSGHNPWQTDHAKAMDVRRGATKKRPQIYFCAGPMAERQNDEICRASQLVRGWTEEHVKYFHYISETDISDDAMHPSNA